MEKTLTEISHYLKVSDQAFASFFFLQFWDDPWWWGKPLPQDRRQHHVTYSGWEQWGLLLVHLQSTVPQPFPWVGQRVSHKCPNIHFAVITAFFLKHGWFCCVHQNSPGVLFGGWAKADRSVQVPWTTSWAAVWCRHTVQVAIWLQGQTVQPWFCQGKIFTFHLVLIKNKRIINKNGSNKQVMAKPQGLIIRLVPALWNFMDPL